MAKDYNRLIIREYEESVDMPLPRRLTYVDDIGVVHLRDGVTADIAAKYAKKCADWLQFGWQADDVLAKDFNPNSLMSLGPTPEIYRRCGLSSDRLLYTQAHFRAALDKGRAAVPGKPHPHGLSLSLLKRLPELLEHPVMLCDNPAPGRDLPWGTENAMLAVLCAIDARGDPIIASICPDAKGSYIWEDDHTQTRTVTANLVMTVFPKENFPEYFEKAIKPERVFYYHEKRGQALNALTGRFMPRSHILEPNLWNRIIRPPHCIVNRKNLSTEPENRPRKWPTYVRPGARDDTLSRVREARAASRALANDTPAAERETDIVGDTDDNR